MFFDGTQTRLIKAHDLPRLVASECTGPHLKNHEHHIEVTEDITALGYNTPEGSAVFNSACFGCYTSQPRWLAIFARNSVGNIANYRF